MEAISNVASGFIGLFQAGGETFMGWVTGIIPLVSVLDDSGKCYHQTCRYRES